MRAMFVPDDKGKPLLWLCAESYPEHRTLLQFVNQAKNGLDITNSHKLTENEISSIYIEPLPTEKKPFWRKWLDKRKPS